MLPAPTAPAETLQNYLKLVTEAFKRTMALAESLQEVVGEAASVADLANAAFSETLGDYPHMELQWLRLLHHSKTSQVSLQPHAPPWRTCTAPFLALLPAATCTKLRDQLLILNLEQD